MCYDLNSYFLPVCNAFVALNYWQRDRNVIRSAKKTFLCSHQFVGKTLLCLPASLHTESEDHYVFILCSHATLFSTS